MGHKFKKKKKKITWLHDGSMQTEDQFDVELVDINLDSSV